MLSKKSCFILGGKMLAKQRQMLLQLSSTNAFLDAKSHRIFTEVYSMVNKVPYS
jgi:hypothetical protein